MMHKMLGFTGEEKQGMEDRTRRRTVQAHATRKCKSSRDNENKSTGLKKDEGHGRRGKRKLSTGKVQQ